MQEEHLEQKGFHVGIGESVKAPVQNFMIDDNGITITFYTGIPRSRHYDWDSMKSIRIEDEKNGPIIIESFDFDIHIWNYDDMDKNINLVQRVREKISPTSSIEKAQKHEKRFKKKILFFMAVFIGFLLIFVFSIISGLNFLPLLMLGFGWFVVMYFLFYFKDL